VADRRAFICGVVGVVFPSSFSAFAQLPTKVPRIGILGNNDGPLWESFRGGLRELGYVDGRTVTLEWRWADSKADRYPAFAVEFVHLKVDLIVTSSIPATRAAKQVTSSIPIVMLNAVYPERIGLVESLARPGGNITGFSDMPGELVGKRLQLLKEMAPTISRVAVLWNPASPLEQIGFREMQAVAAAVGVEIQSIEVRASEDYPAAFASVTASRADALYANGNSVNFKNGQLIADFALRSRLPSSCDERMSVKAGSLLSYGSSYIDTYRRAATYVDKILKGAKPADLPIEQPTKFELVINLRTAKALGLTIPHALLLRADEVLE
jgi:putative tryptophan/tyrosine transport system substrate-binding protein